MNRILHTTLFFFFFFTSLNHLFAQTYTIDQGGNVSTCSGTVYDSGGASGDYDDDENYTMTFCSDNSQCIDATFNFVDIEEDYDFLYIYDGPNTASPLIATITGTDNPGTISSFYGCLTFQFVSNDTITAGGFEASLSCSGCSLSGGGDGTMTALYDQQLCGLNYTQRSQKVASRYTPSAVNSWGQTFPVTLNFNDLPLDGSCSATEKAILWWTESSTNNTATVTITNSDGQTFNYNASAIGSGPDKCWGEGGTRNFRIDVTSCVSGNGNYSVDISSGSSAVDGVTLMIIYRDFNATYEGNLIIFDGSMVTSSGGAFSQSLTGIDACQNSVNGRGFVITGDIQDNVSGQNSSTINGANYPFQRLFWNYDEAPTTVTAGQTTAAFGTNEGSGSDCYSWVAMGLYFQTTSCSTCPSGAFATQVAPNDVTCEGFDNGSATAQPGGGAPPYSYSWSNGGNTQTISGLSPGTYTVEVTDNIGCTSQGTVTIEEPTELTASVTAVDASCFGNDDGEASVAISGGTEPYSVSWSNGDNGTDTQGLTAGNYSVTVTDQRGCNETISFVIDEPDADMTVSFDVIDASCDGGNDGEVTANVSGGTPGYDYSWSDGQTTQTATGLAAGDYTVTATDQNGCAVIGTATVNDASQIQVNFDITPPLCFGDENASITATVSGGTPGYTYDWSPEPGTGQGTDNVSGLEQGDYELTVTDDANCTHVATATITGPDTLDVIDTLVTHVSCFGGSDGEISLTVTGGVEPYSYNWSNGDNTANPSGLLAGTYELTITDDNDCVYEVSFLVNEPDDLVIDLTEIVSLTCFESADGSIEVNINGGVEPYQISWSNGVNDATIIDNLDAGDYTITVEDDNGCITTETYTVTQPDDLDVTINQLSDVTCFGFDDGFIEVSATGGTTPYTFDWSNGETGNSITNLAPGQYSVTVTDDNSCDATFNFDIDEPDTLSVEVLSDSICLQTCTGEVILDIAGGVEPYEVIWETGEDDLVMLDMCEGDYPFDIVDANGCSISDTASVVIFEPIEIFIAVNPDSGNMALSVDFDQEFDPNENVDDFYWDFGDGGSSTDENPSYTFTNQGIYFPTVNVTDMNGCTYTDSLQVIVEGVSTLVIPNVFSPNGDGVNDVFMVIGENLAELDAQIFNRWGQMIYSFEGPNGGWDGRTKSGVEASEGVYFYLIKAKGLDGEEFEFQGSVHLVR